MIYFAKWRSKIENMVAPVPKIILNPKSHSWQPHSLVSHRKGYLLPSLNLFKVAGDKAETERSISERVNPKELFSTHSIPSIIVSDKGPQFSSEPFLLSFSKYDVVLETIFPKYLRQMVKLKDRLHGQSNDPQEWRPVSNPPCLPIYTFSEWFLDHSPFLGTESSFYRRSKVNK